MKVLFCGTEAPSAPIELRKVLPSATIVSCPHDQVRDRVGDTDILIPLLMRVDSDLIARASSAKLINQWGVGLEGVDIDAATARGIPVCNVPSDATANAESTAEHAVLLMLGAARRIGEWFQSFSQGRWGAPMGEGLFGNAALIVGFGRVGRALAPRLTAMGMRVAAIRRHPDAAEAAQYGLTRCGGPADLLAMVADADFVVSTASVTAESRGLLDQAVFRAMKPTAIVINVSRGAVINEGDLIEALRGGTIAGAGLDVFAQEPLPPDSPLLSMPNVFATPHVGGVTRQSYEGMARVVADNIQRVERGEAPRYCVNLPAR
jgi:phosphoglycerate dehydrogenase-like enzyme